MGGWRGQGGRRAKGRRRDQDPESDNTAWLAELEREAARADDDEDWASTLRGRRQATPPPHADDPPPSATRPSTPDPPSTGAGWPPPDRRPPGGEAEPARPGGWEAEPTGPGGWEADAVPRAAHDPPSRPAEPWSTWRPYDAEQPGEEQRAWTEPEWGLPRGEPGHGERPPAGPDAPAGGSGPPPAEGDAPTGTWPPVEPADREPDYPALFGELYRRRSGRQDPVWEAPPAAEPLPPDPGTPDPPAAWPFEESTQTWEPSDRSFIWPADELPATSTEWDQPAPQAEWDQPASAGGWDPPAGSSWLDDPAPEPTASTSRPPGQPASPPDQPPWPPYPDQTAAWPAQEPASQPPAEPAPSTWPGPPDRNRVPPAPADPPADWAAAIPTDVPAARRVADRQAATGAWRPDEAADAEPAVPLVDRGPARLGPGLPVGRDWAEAGRGAPPEDGRAAPSDGQRTREGGRPTRSWPRIVAIVSWIVLMMVVCWFYVFPWLERVLPENF